MDTNAVAEWMLARIKSLPEGNVLRAIGAKFFPDAAPEKTSNPCGVYQLIEAPTPEVLDPGAVNHGVVTFQVRFYASRRKSAGELREAFRQAFQNLEPVEITDGLRLEGSSFEVQADTFEAQTEDYGALGIVALSVSSGSLSGGE